MNTIGVPFFNFQKKRRGEITPHPPPPPAQAHNKREGGEGRGEVSPAFFLKIENAVLRAFWRQNTIFFSAGISFCIPYMERLSKSPYSKKPPLPRKIPVCAPAPTQIISLNIKISMK